MTLQETIREDLKNAMRAKQELTLSVIRMLQSAMHNRLIEKRAKENGAELSEDEIFQVIRSEAKKRKDAISEFTKAERAELVQKETEELAILVKYLPPEVDDKVIENAVAEVAKEMGDITVKDFGKVMAATMKRLHGQASGDRVSIAVKKLFS